jgi:hypothetical protein
VTPQGLQERLQVQLITYLYFIDLECETTESNCPEHDSSHMNTSAPLECLEQKVSLEQNSHGTITGLNNGTEGTEF